MHKGKYNVEPLSELLTSYVAKNDKVFFQTEIDNLPDAIKESVNIEREKDREKDKQKMNKIFTDLAFKDLEQFHKKLPYSKKFGYSVNDLIYFMYKLRDNSNLVINSGYTKYSFVLEIIDGNTPNDDSVYKLIITETETGEIGIYETTVGRFD
jgi:hypothetical protein